MKPCLLTLVVFWGVATPGEWESRLGVHVHTSAECKTDISAVLTVTSGPDPQLMSKLDSLELGGETWLRLLPRALTEWLFRVGRIGILCS